MKRSVLSGESLVRGTGSSQRTSFASVPELPKTPAASRLPRIAFAKRP